jgi:hypothetical protein
VTQSLINAEARPRGAEAAGLGAFLAHNQTSYQVAPQRNVVAMPQRQMQNNPAAVHASAVVRASKIVEALRIHSGSSATIAHSERQLANYLGLDKSTVWRASTNLAKRGVIRRKSEGNRLILTLVN